MLILRNLASEQSDYWFGSVFLAPMNQMSVPVLEEIIEITIHLKLRISQRRALESKFQIMIRYHVIESG